jgi:hypothetical protein
MNNKELVILAGKKRGGGGGAEKFVITVTGSGGSYSADKTFAQILAAYQAGSVLEVHHADAVAELTYMDADGAAEWCQVGMRINGIGAIIYNVSSSGGVDTWTMVNKTFVEVPAVEEDLESASITLASAADNTIYEYGELTALTVTAITNPGDFIIRFTSGATATTTNFPATMKFPEAFAPEANMRYEINCSNGYALAVGWPTT